MFLFPAFTAKKIAKKGKEDVNRMLSLLVVVNISFTLTSCFKNMK